MKRFQLSLVSILVIFACLALPSCKKKDAAAPAADAAAPAADAAKADAAKAADAAKPADAAAADAAKADAAKPADAAAADAAKPADAAAADAAKPADAAVPVALKFAKMAKNPLFIDGNVIHLGYELTIDSEDSSRKGAPGWKCEEEDSCTLEVKSDLDCTVKIVLNEDKYSASQLSCVAKDGAFFPADTFPNGIWAVDSHGIYFSASTDPMKRRATPGCEDCKEGTLEYDFEDMDDREAWVVNFESAVAAVEGDEEEHGCDDGCEVTGSTYKCCTTDASGYQIVWDNDRGLVEYDGVAYGEKDGEFGNLSIKVK